METVNIIGGGLAGSEAALQLACRGISVRIVEMRPKDTTGAHKTDRLAEIVCTNSFKSQLLENASGLLKAEMDLLGCELLRLARDAEVPAGHALAVDRDIFSQLVTDKIAAHPLIEVVRSRQDDLECSKPAIIATGPLTAKKLSESLRTHIGDDHLFFYDAIAPSIEAGSLDSDAGFWASRYGKGDADYFNIPLSKEQYLDLIDRIRNADIVTPHDFEDKKYFESCLPVEEIVARGEDTLRFGPLKPRGLPDPQTGLEPYAVIQLRQESKTGSLLGLVGFQTRMTYGAQKSVIGSIRGLEKAKILRFGSIHRNIFLNVPVTCTRYQRDRRIPGLFYGGQICGVEGYVECIMSGMTVALSIFADALGRSLPELPSETMIGSLLEYIHTPTKNFQPMNANMGVLPSTARRRGPRKERYLANAERAVHAMERYRDEHGWLFPHRTDEDIEERPANFA